MHGLLMVSKRYVVEVILFIFYFHHNDDGPLLYCGW
jgi:hypothetical protein